MAAMNETVYIKGDKNVEVTSPEVSLGQVVKIECGNPEIVPKLKALKLLKFVDNPKKAVPQYRGAKYGREGHDCHLREPAYSGRNGTCGESGLRGADYLCGGGIFDYGI